MPKLYLRAIDTTKKLNLNYIKLKEDWAKEFKTSARFVDEEGQPRMKVKGNSIKVLENIVKRFGVPLPNFN